MTETQTSRSAATTATPEMTASGHSLRDYVIDLTGYDPTTEPAFEWSTLLACDDCGIHNSTALLVVDDEPERLCYHCAVERIGGDL